MAVNRESSGLTYYTLIWADDKVVAAKIGRSSGFDAAAIGAAYLGIAGALVGAASKKRHHEKLKEESARLRELPIEKIIEMNRENFQMAYTDIEKTEIDDNLTNYGIGKLKIEGRVTLILQKLGLPTTKGLFREKPRRTIEFSIAPMQDLDQCRTVVSNALKKRARLG